MEPSALIPPADVLPVAPWLIRLLLDATFAAHILLMNVMFGLVLLGLVRSFRADASGDAARMAGYIPNATALTVNMAIPPLLFLQALYGQFFYVSSALMGVYWYGVALAVMAAYGLAYWQKARLGREGSGRGGRGGLVWALMAALLVFVSLAQTSNALLVIRPDLWTGHFENPAGTLTSLNDPSFTPRWLHFVIASLAVGGLSLAMAGRKRVRRGESQGARLIVEGMAWLGWATLAQIADGLWFLFAQPEAVRSAFLGGDAMATALVVVGVALGGMTAAFAFTGRVVAGAASLTATVAVMVVVRDIVRAMALAPFHAMATHEVRPEYLTLVVFLACLIVTVVAVFWATRGIRVKAPQQEI